MCSQTLFLLPYGNKVPALWRLQCFCTRTVTKTSVLLDILPWSIAPLWPRTSNLTHPISMTGTSKGCIRFRFRSRAGIILRDHETIRALGQLRTERGRRTIINDKARVPAEDAQIVEDAGTNSGSVRIGREQLIEFSAMPR